MTASDVAPALAGLFYLALGLTALFRPESLLEGFRIRAEGRDARNEIRSVYGGLPLAVGSLAVFSLSGGGHAAGILFSLAVISLGMAVGRILSAVIDRGLGRLPAVFLGVEGLLAVALAIGAADAGGPVSVS